MIQERVNVRQAITKMREGAVVECIFDGLSYKLDDAGDLIVFNDSVWYRTDLNLSKIDSEWIVLGRPIITLSSLRRTHEVTQEHIYMEDDIISCIQKIRRDLKDINLMSFSSKQEIITLMNKYYGDRLSESKK
ncbi:hypothetical protein GQ473_07310 [archaeon]|nr:hypothetical protein [archaeon]